MAEETVGDTQVEEEPPEDTAAKEKAEEEAPAKEKAEEEAAEKAKAEEEAAEKAKAEEEAAAVAKKAEAEVEAAAKKDEEEAAEVAKQAAEEAAVRRASEIAEAREERKKREEDEEEGDETAESLQSDYDLGSLQGYGTSLILYGEGYGEGEGEDYFVAEVPSEVKDLGDELEKLDEDLLLRPESPKTELSEGSERGEQESVEEEEDKVRSPTRSQSRFDDLDRLSSESLFDTLYLQPKEKTMSEIKFETEHREYIEEEMKKFVQGRMPVEKVPEKRKPLEKTKVHLADLDISGLYPAPKVIESEVSFAFDEEDEPEKGRPHESDAEVVKHVMESLKEHMKEDPENLLTPTVVNKVQRALDEIVNCVRKEAGMNLPKAVYEAFPDMKPNLRNKLIQFLREKLSRYEKIVEVEEEEDQQQPQEGKRLTRRETVKIRAIDKDWLSKVEEALEEEVKPGKLQRIQVAEKARQKPGEGVKEKRPGAVLEEELEEAAAEDEKKEGFELPEPEAYERINWELFLTESEKKIAADPQLREEMEKYIERRKKELLLERKAQRDKMAREERYKSTDPLIMLENLNLHVTMKFLLNSGEIFTCAYRYFMPFKEIKEDLSGIFRVPPDILIIYRDDVEVKDEERAYDLRPKIEPFDSVTFRLLTFDNDRWRLKSWHLELPVPDIITCTVETGQDHKGVPEYKEVVVEIEQKRIKKPFVGGYRDVCTGIEYHHAFSQSAPREPTIPYDRMVTTDTQTADLLNKKVDTDCNKYTQMSRSDYYVSNLDDIIITPKPYVDYDTWMRQRDIEGKVLLIQRYLRAMIIRKFIKKKSEEYRARKIWEEEEERKRVVNREIRVRQNILNMVYPKTKTDFEALYAMVERWRKAQVERIGRLKTEAPRKAELCGVLEKEIKLLEAIELHRIAVAKAQRKKKELNFLAKVSAPVTWTGYRGMTIKMDTLKTQRARELMELYLALSRDDLNYQDRIELLISLKYALRVNCTRLTDEITSLLNRECELLIRGVSSKKLEYLRRRIEHLFQKYFKEPDFNPEVAKYDPEYNQEPLKQNVMFCKMCHQMKLYKEFTANARDTSCNVCQSCRTVYNIAVPRIDLNPYRYILKCVRRDEQKLNCYSSCAFILQDEDMRFLVDIIWHGRSVLSEKNNIMDLRMVRWDRNKEWSPWNCILLTELEAKAHLRIRPHDNYDDMVLQVVMSKHLLAKRHFQQLFATEERLRDSGKWANVVDVKNYLPPPITADIWDITMDECTRIKEKGAFYEVHETRRKQDNYVKYI